MSLAASRPARPGPSISLGTTFRALRLPAYRLFWSGQLASQTGTWMQSVAQAWLVLRLTDSPLALGTVATIQFTPILLFSLIGGVLADRLPKHRLLVTTQTVMLVQALTMALLTWSGRIQLWHIYLLAATLGTANALDNPTRQSFVRELVGPADLPNAIALNSMQFNLSRIAGPALSGLLITLVGAAGCFALNAVSSLGVLVALYRLRHAGGAPARSDRSGVLSQIGEGLRYAVTTPDVALVLILMGMLGTFGYNFSVVLPLIARYVLNANPLQFGALTTAMGLGSLLAAFGLAALGRATRRTLIGGAIGFSLLLALVALSRWWLVTIALLVGLGMFSIIFTTTANTRLQLVTPPHLRGRVLSIYMLLFGGTTPIGSLTIGWLAEHGGVTAAVVRAAGLCLLGAGGGLLYLRRHRAQLTADSAHGIAPTTREEKPMTVTSAPSSSPTPSESGARESRPPTTEAPSPSPAPSAPLLGGRLRPLLGLILVLGLVGGGLFGYRWWYDETHFVRTDNAQISGFLVQVGALSPGRIASVRYDLAEPVGRDDVIATLHVPVSITTPTGVTRQEYRATSDTLVEVRSPISGLIVNRLVNPGDTVPAGQTLATIVDPTQLWVNANIEETQIRRVRPGQPVVVHVDTLDLELEGRVVAIRPASAALGAATTTQNTTNPGGGTGGGRPVQLVPVKIALLTTDPRLIIGTSVEVQIRVAD